MQIRKIHDLNLILTLFPDRCIVSIHEKNNEKLPNILIVRNHLYISQLLQLIRNKYNIKKNESIFIYLNNNVIPPSSHILSDVYAKYKSEDNILYITFTFENTFGFV